MRKTLIISFFLLLHSILFSQAQDSTKVTEIQEVLSFAQFMELVETHHPLAMKANLQTEIGRMEVRSNRGGFDPMAYADVSQKYYDELQYYSHQEGGVIIPTWLGIEFEGGYENNDGTYLNPEQFVPEDGLWWAGISVPLGKDLFIDSRRAALRQAQLFQEASEAERTLMLNKVLSEAGKTYWKWFEAYYSYQVFDQSVDVVELRFQNTKAGAESGEDAVIDTIEAKIQMQNRKAQFQNALAKYQNARVQLSTFLWQEGQLPLVIRDDVRPPAIDSIEAMNADELNGDSLLANHPLLRFNRLQIDQLDIDRRLAAEKIKPKIDLKYRALQQAFETNREVGMLQDNYTWGLSFSFPLFIRGERGKLQQIKLKLQQTEYEYANQEQQLMFEIQAAINQWNASAQQVDLYQDASKNSLTLLQAEQQLFDIGESSVFMINSRELGYIKAQLNWIKSISDNQISRVMTYFQLGRLENL
ncbi:MAG: hypothetical protein CMP59_05680 [Flavobacteriales bacterium]|nr:hypothetical protein [Flavobacteriales bacterium]